MGNASKALRAGGSFGTKQFVEMTRKKVEAYEHVIPPDPKTGAHARTETRYRPKLERLIVGVKRPTRAFGRQKDRITRKLGKRIISLPKPSSAVSEKHSSERGPVSFMKKLFQRKSGS